MQLKQFKESYSGVNLIDVYIEVMLYTCSVHLCMSSPSAVFGKGIAVFLITLPVFITAYQYIFHDESVIVI
jgi:hypothetical protein